MFAYFLTSEFSNENLFKDGNRRILINLRRNLHLYIYKDISKLSRVGSWLAIIIFPRKKYSVSKLRHVARLIYPAEDGRTEGRCAKHDEDGFHSFPILSAHNLMNLIARPILACTTVRARSQRIESLGDKAKQRKLPTLRLSKAQRETWTITQSFSLLIQCIFLESSSRSHFHGLNVKNAKDFVFQWHNVVS